MNIKVIIDNKEYEVEVSEEQLKELKKAIVYRKHEDAYWYLTDTGRVALGMDVQDEVDIFRYSTGNYASTKEEIDKLNCKLLYKQQYKDCIGICTPTMADWKDLYCDKYYAYYDFKSGEICINSDCFVKREGVIYSTSKQSILDFIEKVGKETFKEYILEVEDVKED